MLKGFLAFIGVLVVAFVLAIVALTQGWLGNDEVAGDPNPTRRPAEWVDERASVQLDTMSSVGASRDKQVLFGDFHVHTTLSFDSIIMNLPSVGGQGSRPPSDACDFARFCSAIDFWSLNDHAENITPHLWSQTVEGARECNAVSGDPANPDLVTYLGWEWSQIGTTPENHYGHKNVIIRGLEDDEIPTRPIASRSPATDRATSQGGSLGQAFDMISANGQRAFDMIRLFNQMQSTPRCESGVPVRELPDDCMESTVTPEELFAKLDDWGFDSLVIPHGTAWGIYTPAGSDWRKQLAGNDPNRQTLVEIYSGHGSSERLPRWREVDIAEDGTMTCPTPKYGYLPSCWRAGELIEQRCLETGESQVECARRAIDARNNYIAAYQAGWKTLPGFEANDWVNAGQAPDIFQPAFNYRPRSSVQYMLALRDFSDPENPKRFDFGFLGSSDTHTASGGQGYKELKRGEMTDARGRVGEEAAGRGGMFGSSAIASERVAESVPYVSSGESPLQLFEIERASAYMATGGLVAVHSEGRDRDSIWNALERKEVYATSGRRTLLWFDLIDGDDSVPMGSTVTKSQRPRFRVRAVGSFEQKPGCPDHAVDALGPDRLDAICHGECYNPGDARRPITRIEIVRIRPQNSEDEPVDDLVEDPWRTLPCPADGSGCVVEFSDNEFEDAQRDTVYYARAIEAKDQLIHGSNPLGCEYDEDGNCVKIDPCGMHTDASDDCLSEAEPRAWSSPIYVDFGAS